MRIRESTRGEYRASVAAVSRAVATVVVLVAGAILESVKLYSLQDQEIWGHLRVGSWILQNGNWPRTGLFSQASHAVWRDFSWGYDVLAAGAYAVLGLRAVPVLLMGFRVGIALVTFLLAGGRKGQFWGAVALSMAAQFAMAGMGPAAAFHSAILLGLELLILMECRNSGDARWLYALPAIFVVWANLDTGFIYGMGLTTLFLAAVILEKVGQSAGWNWPGSPPAAVAVKKAAIAGAASLVASLANPYGYHAYAAFWAMQASPANRMLPSYRAMSFQQPQDYAVLLLAMGAFLALGMGHSRDLFSSGVLVAGAALSFSLRSQAWVVTVVAVAVIGEEMTREGKGVAEKTGFWTLRSALASGGAALGAVILLGVLVLPRQGDVLLAKAGENFPVRACDSIRKQELPRPLFNSYAWGNFLTWYLPEYPVAIDERRGLYSDEMETDYFKVMNAEMPYQVYAPMRGARTLLLDKAGPMGEALRDQPGFRVAYEDKLAVVLVHEGKQ